MGRRVTRSLWTPEWDARAKTNRLMLCRMPHERHIEID
jgi:hypothetical protein